MPITEEQRRRAESNRLAALAKRKAFEESTVNQQKQNQQQEQQHDNSNNNPWRLFKCRKLSPDRISTTKPRPCLPIDPNLNAHLDQKFRVRLEICSPDSFSLTPQAIKGFLYPGEEECLMRLNCCLSDVMPSHYTQNHGGGKACVYKLREYDVVLSCLKNYKVIEIEKIPFSTLNVVQRFSHSFETGRWEPFRPEHLADDKVDELIGKLPKKLLDMLLPFQLDGLRFGLRRGGRCLIADEMGLGKTLQAIAIAGCFMHEGSILVVCPAILRFSWAEELERWLPSCLPSEIHLVFGHQNNPVYLTRFPRVVVISYTMLHHLRKSILEREWALLIVDESHHVRCSKKKSEPNEVKAVLDVAAKIKRIVLLSGTPSLSRPGLLGQSKYDFAKTYCAIQGVLTSVQFKDFSRGVRLEELNVLLTQTVMIRRLKKHVMEQLPPKRRQIIRLLLKKADIVSAKATVWTVSDDTSESNGTKGSGACCRSSQLSYQKLGIAKLSGFRDWLSIHPLITESDGVTELDENPVSQKMIIFAHHHKVLDGVQEFICEKGVGFVRIDGNTLPRDRQSAVLSFRASKEIKFAIIGITAGGVGLDFSSAQNVVFLELPQSASLMLQAEDRAHRRGQTNAVNIYIFCAKDTMDERHWRYLNKSLHRVSSTTNGKYDAVPEIPVDGVSYLETASNTERSSENQVLESGSYAKLSVIREDSSSLQDMELFEIQNEVTGVCVSKTREQSSSSSGAVQAVDFQLKVEKDIMVQDQELYKYFAADTNVDRAVSESENSSHDGVSTSKVVKGGQPQLEKEQGSCPRIKEIDDQKPVLDMEAVEAFSSQVHALRFEVSKYTGRIHLFSCIPETDLRPQPLFVNFRQEELEALSPAANDNKEPTAVSFKGNPAYRHALLAFIGEWNELRPVEKRKLVGKALQLPLSIELCYLSENINHNTEGLLKGGSKRRITPWFEISHPLPRGAVWKKVNLSSCYGKKEKEYTQGWIPNGEPLCKLCQTPCRSINAKTPEFFEDLFCKLSCYEEYRIRTSSRSLRQELFQIEHGICTNCQLDCHKLVKNIQPLSLERRREYIEKLAPNVASREKLLEKLVNAPSEGNAWHADHIIPVYRGGGECRLENMRTLCVGCHYDVTAAQRTERRIIRAKARAQLKIIMNDLRSDQNMVNDISFKGQAHSETGEDEMEDELLVKVPGSSYSAGKDAVGPESKDSKESSEAEE